MEGCLAMEIESDRFMPFCCWEDPGNISFVMFPFYRTRLWSYLVLSPDIFSFSSCKLKLNRDSPNICLNFTTLDTFSSQSGSPSPSSYNIHFRKLGILNFIFLWRWKTFCKSLLHRPRFWPIFKMLPGMPKSCTKGLAWFWLCCQSRLL